MFSDIGSVLRQLYLKRFFFPRDVLRWASTRYAKKLALVADDGQGLSFQELGSQVFQLASGLQAQGLEPGARIAFTLPNGIAFMQLRLACYEAGFVAVPLVADLSPAALKNALQACDPQLYVFDEDLLGSAANEILGDWDPRKWVAISGSDRRALDQYLKPNGKSSSRILLPGDLATINFTSGSTGTPKGVMSTHRAWAKSLQMMVQSSLLSRHENEKMLHAIPFATAGWGAVLPCLLGGICSFSMKEFDPAQALAIIESEQITRTFLTPSQIIDFLEDPGLSRRKFASLRAIIYGSAPLSGPKMAEAFANFGPILNQGYGLAEVLPPLAALAPQAHHPSHPMRAGKIAPGVELKITDGHQIIRKAYQRGEVLVRSPTQTPGYWQKPELTRNAVEQGFFRTGDIGFWDEEDYLNIVGRASEQIDGISLHPREIEEIAHGHSGIKECALVKTGKKIELVCSRRLNTRVNEAELRSHLKKRIGDAIEYSIVFLPGDLPRSAAGKIVRGQIGKKEERS